MEDYPASPTYLLDDRHMVTWLNILIGLAVAICVALIALIAVGYGTVHIQLPSGTTLKINGRVVTARQLKLRPGDYPVIISSPLITPLSTAMHVSLFRTTTFSPKPAPRSVDAIASTLIGAVGEAGPPKPSHVTWFVNNTWFVGLLVPGNIPLAAHYDSSRQQWQVGFLDSPSYPGDSSKLPADVADYVKLLETSYRGG